MKTNILRSKQGFTLVELMIALSVLSTILVFCTVMMIRISSLYNKGVNAANLQNATRNVATDISSSVEFTNNSFQTGSQSYGGLTIQSYCVGQIRYSYVLGRKLGTDDSIAPVETTHHVLWRDTMKTDDTCTPLNITVVGTPPDTVPSTTNGDGYEMIGNNMRLVKFDVNPVIPSVFSIDVATSFGDKDLLNGSFTACNSTKGNEFCSISEINTTVSKRIQ